MQDLRNYLQRLTPWSSSEYLTHSTCLPLTRNTTPEEKLSMPPTCQSKQTWRKIDGTPREKRNIAKRSHIFQNHNKIPRETAKSDHV